MEITHKFEEDKMDPVFTPQFTKMNDTYRQQVLSEMQAMHGGPQAWMQAQQPALTLMEEVLDIANSPAAANDTTHFWYDDVQFKIEKGDEPKMTGGYTLANSVADALVLQCYESESMAPFGHALTMEQWRDICAVKEVYDGLLFTTHAAAVNLAYPLVSRIREELNNSNRKFVFLCGHTRAHGAPPTEPWLISESFTDAFRQCAEMKYRLMPYVYAQAKDCSMRGLPMVRALLVEFPDDPGAWLVEDEYMFGSQILVAPLLETGTGRTVYLYLGHTRKTRDAETQNQIASNAVTTII